jgi:Tfp pilus assembly protein PilF
MNHYPAKERPNPSHSSNLKTEMTSNSPLRRVPIESVVGALIAVAMLQACDTQGKADDAAQQTAAASAAAPGVDPKMQEGLDKLYKGNDAPGAVDAFRDVLSRIPTHYGARFQLAKALDMAGRPTEARPVWVEALGAAIAIKDTVTENTARVRIAQPDTVTRAAMMATGLNLLYNKNDAAGAAAEFRKILERNPEDYGGTFQLAKALDKAGKQAEARPFWQKMVTMADAVKDKETGDTARARLSQSR